MINQQIIKQNNVKKLFSVIWDNEPISRIALSKMTSLSKTTVSSLVDELIKKGYVVDRGLFDTGKQGRKPSSLYIDDKNNVLIVFNWRATELEVSLVNIKGDVLYYDCLKLSNKKYDYPVYIREVFDTLIQKELKERKMLAFCLVVPSLLDAANERMISTTLPVDTNECIINKLKSLFNDVPFAIINDTACYAYAEFKFGNHKYDTFHFININDGVGAVIVNDGVMIQGEDGMRAQFGHMSINRNGRKCLCGNKGCLENEIGEAVLERKAKELGVLNSILVDDHISFLNLGRQADAGKKEARILIDSLASDLAYALKNLLVINYSKHIVIGGTGQDLGDYYIKKLDSELKTTGFLTFIENVEVCYTNVREHAILRGAAIYFIDKYFDFFESMNEFIAIES